MANGIPVGVVIVMDRTEISLIALLVDSMVASTSLQTLSQAEKLLDQRQHKSQAFKDAVDAVRGIADRLSFSPIDQERLTVLHQLAAELSLRQDEASKVIADLIIRALANWKSGREILRSGRSA